jgi:hypothetical protein
MDELLMSALRALVIYQVTGVSSFNVIPGVFYRVDASGGNVIANLPPVATAQSGDWNVIKKIDASANTVTITAWVDGTYAEFINGVATNVISTQNQSHNVIPGAPSGGETNTGDGWMTL